MNISKIGRVSRSSHLTSSHFPGDADVAVADLGLETLGATPRVVHVPRVIPGDPTSAAVRANDGRNGRTRTATATARTAHTGIGGLTITWLQRPYESWQLSFAETALASVLADIGNWHESEISLKCSGRA